MNNSDVDNTYIKNFIKNKKHENFLFHFLYLLLILCYMTTEIIWLLYVLYISIGLYVLLYAINHLVNIIIPIESILNLYADENKKEKLSLELADSVMEFKYTYLFTNIAALGAYSCFFYVLGNFFPIIGLCYMYIVKYYISFKTIKWFKENSNNKIL